MATWSKRVAGALGLTIGTMMTSPALAAGGGWSLTVEGFYIIDFIIYVGLLWFFLKGPAKSFLVNRYEKVKAELEAATRLREAAEARLAELDKLVSQVETEVGTIKQQFQADGEREKERILHEAEAQVDKIQQNARKTLEQEMAKLREQLEHELVAQVLEATEAKVRAKLDPAAQKRLATSYVDDLEKLERLDRAA